MRWWKGTMVRQRSTMMRQESTMMRRGALWCVIRHCDDTAEHHYTSRKHHNETKETLMRQGSTIMRQYSIDFQLYVHGIPTGLCISSHNISSEQCHCLMKEPHIHSLVVSSFPSSTALHTDFCSVSWICLIYTSCKQGQPVWRNVSRLSPSNASKLPTSVS